jgi:phosphate starvation-inducible PhoH-like protein
MEEFICPDELGDHFPVLIQKNTAAFEGAFGLEISLRGNKIMFSGEGAQARKFKKYLQHLALIHEEHGRLRDQDIQFSLQLVESGEIDQIQERISKKHNIKVDGKEVFPKTPNQHLYVQAIQEREMVFGIGPAGTGKTFLAIAMALNFLINKRVERIVLTRPVVEAGEKLGFLPGDIQQKINPYLRPLYDALYFLIGFERTSELIEKGIIEIAPLAYMRGRTINDAFIILDEGQNTVDSQMKMFLTRFGLNSRVVVTADITQIDLDMPKKSGIFRAIRILKNVPGISVVHLTMKDVVRHPLIQRIIEAYERVEK